MRHNKLKIFALALAGALAIGNAQAQQVNTLYFLENSPMRHYINPALQPISKVYVSLPVIGYVSAYGGNSALTMQDIVFKQNGKTMWFLNPQANQAGFMNSIKRGIGAEAEAQVNFLSFGFRVQDAGYFHFTLNERLDGGVGVPFGLFDFALGGGMKDINGGMNTFDLKKLGMDLSMYTELGMGYSHQINDHWSIGGKLKFLYGTAHIGMSNQSLALNASADSWNVKGQGSIVAAAPFNLPKTIDSDGLSEYSPDIDLLSLWKPQGFGGALDFGLTYKPHEMVQITASVTDLGFIRWHKGQKYNYNVDGTYDGVGEIDYGDYVDENGDFNSNQLMDTVSARIENVYNTALTTESTTRGFMDMLSPKLNIGVDANFWENRVGVGVYSRTKFTPYKIYEEVTLGAAFRPFHWLQLAASYSFINGKGGNIGAALGIVTYEGIGFTLVADYVPCYYAHYSKTLENGSIQDIPIPYKTAGVNIAAGINIVIGHKRDRDKDGVLDKYDLCPSTPKNVQVDKYGCPIDSDGDGVPDYLDECPGTPTEAYGLVDVTGCPIDTDGDGVPDYLDKCPKTPAAAYGKVDDTGCPTDSDGDEVPDYLDECPGTPAEARGFVDEKGCLLDTDNDGVPDYMDECPNTPAEAIGYLSETGCPIDTDEDGVPDYIDECPDTPTEAIGYLSKTGCPIDTDGDGVPDYCDQCPTVSGDKNNHGCPVIKREVRNLLKKAMQGIQFETGKANIKKASYPLLNQIAKIFIDNPEYQIEVQGHTDNVGSKKLNQDLSERRAAAVMEYLVGAGVDKNRMTSHGYGDTMPIESNATAKGRTLNRRVEFVISFEEVNYEEIVTTTDSSAIEALQSDSINGKVIAE